MKTIEMRRKGFEMRRSPSSSLLKEKIQQLLIKNSLQYRQFKKYRETEITLERIRSRALMMKESRELPELASALFQAYQELGYLPAEGGAYFSVINVAEKTAEVWMLYADGKLLQQCIQTPLDPFGLLKKYQFARKQQEPLIVRDFSGMVLKNYLEILTALPHSMKDKAYRKLISYTHERLLIMDALFQNGTIGIISFEGLTKQAAEALIRFAPVFELIYTRFLDLQKAEAHNREVLIEAAFQRVRDKSMAMHKSAQLADTAKVLFEQFGLLGKIPDRMAIGTINEETRKFELWLTDQEGNRLNQGFFFPIDEPTSMAKIYKAWKEGKKSVIVDLSGKNLRDWLQFVKNEVMLPVDETKIRGRRLQQAAFFSQGFLLFTTHEPVADDIMQLLVRFARVFDLAYTRFRDLQKAETQALEAIKASAIDRVRAEIASMRTTDDLQRITPLVWQELNVLGVPFVRCGVFIIDESKANEQAFLSTPDGRSLAVLNLPFQSNALTEQSVEHWRKGMVYQVHWNKKDFQNWTQSMLDQGQISSREMYLGSENSPESLYLQFVPFKQGMLYVGNTVALTSCEIELVKSLAEAFSIAYTRYEDFDRLEKAKKSVEYALTELKSTQAQLIQREKMASLGELTAGIAHEIQNPLNFVNNFSELNKELIVEMKQALNSGDIPEVNLIANNIEANEGKINVHGKRADAIVKAMLQHSQLNMGREESTDINDLADEYLRLSFHGVRAKDKAFNAILKTDFDEKIENIQVIPQDIGRVFLNLYNNAFFAVNEKKKLLNGSYEPVVSVKSRKVGNKMEISVKDNGIGIPQKILDKIFQPFFTTKPTGQGTGLGLSLSYEIVKAHGAELKVESKEGEGAEFIVQFPVK